MAAHFGFDFYFHDNDIELNFIYPLATYLFFEKCLLTSLIIQVGLFVFGIELIGYKILEVKQCFRFFILSLQSLSFHEVVNEYFIKGCLLFSTLIF